MPRRGLPDASTGARAGRATPVTPLAATASRSSARGVPLAFKQPPDEHATRMILNHSGRSGNWRGRKRSRASRTDRAARRHAQQLRARRRVRVRGARRRPRAARTTACRLRAHRRGGPVRGSGAPTRYRPRRAADLRRRSPRHASRIASTPRRAEFPRRRRPRRARRRAARAPRRRAPARRLRRLPVRGRSRRPRRRARRWRWRPTRAAATPTARRSRRICPATASATWSRQATLVTHCTTSRVASRAPASSASTARTTSSTPSLPLVPLPRTSSWQPAHMAPQSAGARHESESATSVKTAGSMTADGARAKPSRRG